MKKNYTIYTDGSCTGHWMSGNNTGKSYGSFAFCVLENGKKIHEHSVFEWDTTNNRMEISGVLYGLKFLKSEGYIENIKIYSDSLYVINSSTRWLSRWKKEWEKNINNEIKNRDLWEDMYETMKDMDITFCFVKGHNGNEWNEYVDDLCTQEVNKQGLKSFEQMKKNKKKEKIVL